MKNIIFFVRHFTERGTETSIYNYARYNEEILNNKSYIVSLTREKSRALGWEQHYGRLSYPKFYNRFTILEINDIQDITKIIDEYKIDFFYTQVYGNYDSYPYEFGNRYIWKNCKTIKHCVFTTTFPESDFYISIGNNLNYENGTNFPVIPYIIDLPNINDDLRKDLNIPEKSIVIGRYGGFTEFNIEYVHNCIINILQKNDNIYFLFMNTEKFYQHPRIIYLEASIDMDYKTKFINTCSAMIHARQIGETFGASIAEFSLRNKPIITTNVGSIEHLKILNDKAIIYTSEEELDNIFNNIKDIINSRNDWNAYQYYNPQNIMKLFDELVFSR